MNNLQKLNNQVSDKKNSEKYKQYCISSLEFSQKALCF